MEKQLINKNVSEVDLNHVLNGIEDLNKKLNRIGLDIFSIETENKILSKPSHYVFSIIHRAIEINRGFKNLVETNNWITAIHLMRIQADNCMRLFAMALVSDKLDFYNRVLNGEHVRNIQDSDGKKMTDLYLSQKLDQHSPGFRMIYENTSAFIHFSKEHIDFGSDKYINGENFAMVIRLSETKEFSIFEKVDYAFNMFYLGKELFKLLKGYRFSVEKLFEKFKK
jgi:hypothetical protein